MRSGSIVLFLLLSTQAFAQLKDSLLREVTVYGIPEEKYLVGSEIVTADSLLYTKEKSAHLGDLIALQLPVYFRNYGSGMVSGISLRGTSPQHTAVRWNGISINSFSHGQTDFSILPATVFEEIKIHQGGGSAKFGSGAFGGSILLSSAPADDTPITFTQENGSFGKYFTSARINIPLKRWRFVSKAYNLQSENDFKILSTGERQPHASFRQYGFLQDVSCEWSGQMLLVHYWYHYADRDIQPNIGKTSSQEEQQDENHRLAVDYKLQHGKGLLHLRSGYTRDQIIYNHSPSLMSRYLAGANEQFWLLKKIRADLGVEVNYIHANIEEYGDAKTSEYRYDFTSAFNRQLSKRVNVAVNLRQPFIPGMKMPFLPYVGAEYFIVQKESNNISLFANASKNYRVPTFNDRYWLNSGDRKLDPETSHAGELGWRWKHKHFSASQTAYMQQVDDWILWVPGEDGNYRPRNVKQVTVKGIESKILLHASIRKIDVTSSVAYQYVESKTTRTAAFEVYALHKQLIYTPKHTANVSIQFLWQRFSIMGIGQYTGERFTDSANTAMYALPYYLLFNAYTSWYTIVNRHRFDIGFTVRNLSNEDYNQYAGKAMPARNYSIQLTYQLNNLQK